MCFMFEVKKKISWIVSTFVSLIVCFKYFRLCTYLVLHVSHELQFAFFVPNMYLHGLRIVVQL